MNVKLFLLFALILSSCLADQSDEATEKFGFLLGEWEGVGVENGTTTELWKMHHNYLEGIGLTLENSDTTFYEEMTIAQKGEIWFLSVAGPNEEPVSFEITELKEKAFTATNPMHDFPKSIKYWLQNDTLKASVAGDNMEIGFDFVKN